MCLKCVPRSIKAPAVKKEKPDKPARGRVVSGKPSKSVGKSMKHEKLAKTGKQAKGKRACAEASEPSKKRRKGR